MDTNTEKYQLELMILKLVASFSASKKMILKNHSSEVAYIQITKTMNGFQ